MATQRYGIVIRSYTKKPEEVEDRAQRALEVAQRAHQLHFGRTPVFSTIILLVPKDYDCGQTADAIRKKFAAENLDRFVVLEAAGHHSCEVLNRASQMLLDVHNVDRMLIMSGKAAEYLTAAAMENIDLAFDRGAKVVGFAVDELADIVREGRVQNTFCAWDLKALFATGGFDSRTGVEELAPTVRLVRDYGPCVAVLEAPGGKLDILQSETARARHAEVMATKEARQLNEARRMGVDFVFIREGVMPGCLQGHKLC